MKKIIFLLVVVNIKLTAQYFSNGFNFYLPSTDSTTQKFLPNFPILDIKQFVTISNEGHFSINSNRIRFWGTNAGAEAAFPYKLNSNAIAGRLRKFGFNLVRLHHLDNPWSNKSLLNDHNYTRSLNSSNLDLLENFIASLKRNGIYVNVNLHVSRTFGMFDGVVAYDSLPEFGKAVNFFDPYIIKLHKEYAQQLLNHVNPYTGLSLVNDPVMAMLEITNENSLYRYWRENKLKPISHGGVLPIYYSEELDLLWNEFLKNKYSTNDNLKNIWNKGRIDSGKDEQIQNGSFEESKLYGYWFIEQHNGATADTSIDRTTAASGNRSLKINVTNATGTDWHIQIKIPSIRIIKDSVYTLTFYCRAEVERPFSVSVMNDVSPYTGYAWAAISANSTWKKFSISFKASETNLAHTRISFLLGNQTGAFWIDDISFTKAGLEGLKQDESLDLMNIARMDFSECNNYTDQRVKDLSEFYISTERKYFQEMISFLKDTLGVKVPITTTNWNTGIADIASFSDADYIDNHAYWDHPNFPNIPWSSTDWFINNKPMVKEDGGIIPGLFASVPIAGKPFTVSEYNHPFPNQFQVESILFSIGYASFNDADAFMFFAYDEPQDFNVDKINNYFAINRNSVLMSFFPSIAHAFRNYSIQPSVNPIILDYSADTLFAAPKYDSGDWRGFSLFNSKISLNHSVKIGKLFGDASSDFSGLQSSVQSPFTTDTDEIIWNNSLGTLQIKTDNFIGVTGYLYNLRGKRVNELMVVNANTNDFGTITWASNDGSVFPFAKYSLLTVASKIQNLNMIWNSNNTSINNNWGRSPTLIYPLNLRLELTLYADSIRVYPLDNLGKENKASSFVVKAYQPNKFILDIDQNINRTLWFGIEKLNDGEPGAVNENGIVPNDIELNQNYPNPFNSFTTFTYSLPESATNSNFISLKIYDSLGKEVAELINKEQSSGKYEIGFDASALASGVYFYQLKVNNFLKTKKFVLIK